MVWLELRVHNTEYDSGWNVGESVWAPTRKENGARWPFWEIIGNVIKNDVIIHLRKLNGQKFFTGFSVAATDGYLTQARASNNQHDWSFSGEYFKADLVEYTRFNTPIPLSIFFQRNDLTLRALFQNNKARIDAEKRRLFYVIQNQRLQCLNGAYFSEFDDTLFSLLQNLEQGAGAVSVSNVAETDEILRYVAQRIGQQKFSENVKRNFSYQCAYPGCSVTDRGFLVGGHIARWADNAGLRGQTANGLCLCLMHDKAFERGFFTLNESFQVMLTRNIEYTIPWLYTLLVSGKGLEIKARVIHPSLDSIHEHWRRIGYSHL